MYLGYKTWKIHADINVTIKMVSNYLKCQLLVDYKKIVEVKNEYRKKMWQLRILFWFHIRTFIPLYLI